MAFNGSGVFQRLYNWTNDAAANIKIRADRMDAEFDGIATGLSTCLTKDGQTTVTANLPMATFKHTNVGDATARTQYATYGQLMDGKGKYPASVGGTADAITLTFSPSFTAYVAGMRLTFIASGANTGAVTVNADGIGAVSVTKRGATALAANDIPGSGAMCDIEYDGTRFQLLNVVPALATESAAGIVELATTAEAQTGTDTERAITPAALQAVTATTTRKGVVELATDAEAQTGTDTERAITPANLQAVTATTTRKGVVELATDAEVATGADADRVSPVSSLVFHQGVAKAWGRFVASSGTPSLSDSYNISSITDLGVGVYQPNFSTAMANSSYSIVFAGKRSGGSAGSSNASGFGGLLTQATGNCSFQTGTTGGSPEDYDIVTFAVWGDR